jgi:hypothetical protein
MSRKCSSFVVSTRATGKRLALSRHVCVSGTASAIKILLCAMRTLLSPDLRITPALVNFMAALLQARYAAPSKARSSHSSDSASAAGLSLAHSLGRTSSFGGSSRTSGVVAARRAQRESRTSWMKVPEPGDEVEERVCHSVTPVGTEMHVPCLQVT